MDEVWVVEKGKPILENLKSIGNVGDSSKLRFEKVNTFGSVGHVSTRRHNVICSITWTEPLIRWVVISNSFMIGQRMFKWSSARELHVRLWYLIISVVTFNLATRQGSKYCECAGVQLDTYLSSVLTSIACSLLIKPFFIEVRDLWKTRRIIK